MQEDDGVLVIAILTQKGFAKTLNLARRLMELRKVSIDGDYVLDSDAVLRPGGPYQIYVDPSEIEWCMSGFAEVTVGPLSEK